MIHTNGLPLSRRWITMLRLLWDSNNSPAWLDQFTRSLFYSCDFFYLPWWCLCCVLRSRLTKVQKIFSSSSPLLSFPLVTGRTIAFYFLLMLNTLKLQSYKILYLELQPPLPCLSALSLSTHDWTLAIIKRRREGGGEGGEEASKYCANGDQGVTSTFYKWHSRMIRLRPLCHCKV